ncbi:hypothetical protein NF212_23765 [Parasalinivibrio latis]|uniref:hypothetical protein n=1 Tax=Parasalinivibrio latis TaxID=2952610 RepID=UPI0030DF50EE
MKVRAVWFSAGLVSGAVLVFVIGGAKLSVEREAHASHQQKQEQISQSRETLLSQQVARSESTIRKLEERLLQRDKEIASIREQVAALSVNLSNSGQLQQGTQGRIEVLKNELGNVNRTLERLNRLYAERYGLLQQMTELNGELAKSKADTDRFKAACDKYKSGTSWDWVSEEDCDSFHASEKTYKKQLLVYKGLTERLMSVQTQIDGESSKAELDENK